jgi:soluble lytic murein transglycosylase
MFRKRICRLAIGMILGLGVTSWVAQAPAATAPKRVPARPAADSLSADEAFTLARQYVGDENNEQFDQVAARAAQHDLGVYVDYWRLRLRLGEKRGDSSSSLDADVQRFLDLHPGSLVADLLRRDWMLNLGRRGGWAMLEAQYPMWVLKDDSQVHCYHLLARSQLGTTVTSAARALLTQTRDLGDACGALIEALASNGSFGRDDLWTRLQAALESNSAPSIRRVALVMGLDADRVDAALNRPARTRPSSEGRLLDIIAVVRLARQDSKLAVDRASSLKLKVADKAFVWSQIAASSMRRLEPEALDWSREGLDADVSDETWGWLARAALRAQDWKTLSQFINRMSAEGRRDPTWIYWQARCLQASGRRDEAEALWRSIAGQHQFYGQLAAEELGQLTATPPRPAAPTEDELVEPDRNPGFARALRFYELGMRPEGNREWNFQLRGMNDRQLLAAAEWACRHNVFDRCVNTAERTGAEHDFALRFISPFNDQLNPVARELGLEPAWVYGLIRQESRFVMDARSSVGAQGLMQMMPSTAKWVARKMGMSSFRPDQLAELTTNLKFGTFYLKSVFDDLDGSSLLASAAYNAGPNRSRSWRASLPGPVEGAIFAEIIPFAETRDYVKKVLSNSTYYASIFSGQPQSLKLRLGSVSPKAWSSSDLP